MVLVLVVVASVTVVAFERVLFLDFFLAMVGVCVWCVCARRVSWWTEGGSVCSVQMQVRGVNERVERWKETENEKKERKKGVQKGGRQIRTEKKKLNVAQMGAEHWAKGS